MAKEIWDAESLNRLSRFVGALQENLQSNAAEEGVRVKDVMITFEDEEKPRGGDREVWGLVSLKDRDDTLLQFEQGDFELGLV